MTSCKALKVNVGTEIKRLLGGEVQRGGLIQLSKISAYPYF